MVVPMKLGPELSVGRPEMLFQDKFESGGPNAPSYDVTLIRGPEATGSRSLKKNLPFP